MTLCLISLAIALAATAINLYVFFREYKEYRAGKRILERRLLSTVERIAAGRRPDGTYNLSREACEQIAKDALQRNER